MVRDKKYLEYLKSQACLVTGLFGNDYDAVDPAHISTAGKGLKSNDSEAIPLLHSLHQECHSKGEISTLRKHMPDWLIREALRAFAREQYEKWKTGDADIHSQ
ncbi:MAG: hypothetical protein CL885_01240 [Dehalococcoidia bacterium]|nr:hypothetical protein [Dehalococcoidia bacterium]